MYNGMKTLDQIAFNNQFLLPTEEHDKPVTDLASLVKLLKVSPSEDLEELGALVWKLCQDVIFCTKDISVRKSGYIFAQRTPLH